MEIVIKLKNGEQIKLGVSDEPVTCDWLRALMAQVTKSQNLTGIGVNEYVY